MDLLLGDSIEKRERNALFCQKGKARKWDDNALIMKQGSRDSAKKLANEVGRGVTCGKLILPLSQK